LNSFREKWGFNLLARYEVLLTRYGPCGSYNPDTGKIIVLAKSDGSFRRSKSHHVVANEIVEIGIEPLIKNLKLTHEERERVTDLTCFLGLGDILQGYTMKLNDTSLSPIGDKILEIKELINF
jgi:hypothetical protein